MGTFVLDRLIRLIVVVLGATLIAFVLLRLAGDPATTLLPVFATPEDRQELREDLGLDQPIPIQFFKYIANAAQGDLGESWKYRQPASEIVLDRFPNTLQLVGLGSIAVAVVVGGLLGILAATRSGGMVDGGLVGFTLVARAIPPFWLGTLLILFFAVNLGWLPTGIGGPEHLVMPVATIALFFIAEFAVVMRASMIEALAADYVRTAKAKGLPTRLVVFRHALRNSLNPLISVVAVNIGVLLGGTVIVENVFAWPGVGLLAVEAVSQTDYPILQATVLVFAISIAVVSTCADLLYGALDPRIRKA